VLCSISTPKYLAIATLSTSHLVTDGSLSEISGINIIIDLYETTDVTLICYPLSAKYAEAER
jgi:hypothetical protein